MKTMMIAAALLVGATAAHAQYGTEQTPPAANAPSGADAAATTKPKGQIILMKGAERKPAGIRAHCSNGTVYWTPEIEEGEYYCESKDAPTPKAQ